ncbi:MAG TPA: hypothetical protein PKH24_21070 [Sedimentisphaerales bacterium]|jgi:hypothetical protein|nr:hypothetical protein [Sedimentisphaerales bacterium]HNU31405.1 hypothetical protein [Sedimentisphaerales bacterium]
MTPVTILREAEVELWEAVGFYESKCRGLGLDFEKEIRTIVELIRQYPNRWPVREDGTHRCLTHRFPYFVVYIHRENKVWIIAFAHCRRRPGYWSERDKTREQGPSPQ